MPVTAQPLFDPSVLRAYDIRGIYGKTLHPESGRHVAAGLIHLARAELGKQVLRVVIGRDGRQGSQTLLNEAVSVFVRAGHQVDEVGLVTSPMLYYSVFSGDYDVGVMVTASHNPEEYNGFKMMIGRQTVHGDRIGKLAEAAREPVQMAGGGKINHISIQADYLEHLLRDLSLKPLRVLWDCGNGAAGPSIEALLPQLPGEHHAIFTEVNGRFANHPPDPTVAANLRVLSQKVKEGGYDAGIAFDGDGDRIGLVDDEGVLWMGDQFLLYLAQDVLKIHPGATIVADVKSSQILFDGIEAAGGRCVVSATGHSLVKAVIARENALLAGEVSGHVFIRDRYYGFDDATYAALRCLEIMGRRDEKLSAFRKSMPPACTTPEIRIAVDEEKKFEIIERLRERLSQRTDITLLALDGVRVTTSVGWWLVRASNTENVLSLRMEAATPENLNAIREKCREELRHCGLTLPESQG